MHSEPDTISHEGIVAAIEHEVALVAVAKGGCSACGKKTACGIGKLAGNAPTTLVRVPAPAGLGLRAGDAVTLTVGEAALTRAALLGYLLPAAAMVAGAGLGHAVYGSDTAAAAAALLGLLAAIGATRWIGRSARQLAPLTLDRRDR